MSPDKPSSFSSWFDISQVGHRESQDNWGDGHVGDTPSLFIEERFIE
ncbi:hypothetical protein OAV21_01420 [bacterium]|jgi:hypothetical protein|nr:hypothetical protein [bacterium]